MPAAELATFALAALLAAPAAASPAAPPAPSPRPCSLALAASRSPLRAEDPRAVELTVAAPAAPRLQASAGELSAPRAAGPGRWTATWTAPPAGIPQVAILAALAGDDCGALAVPLFGSGDAVVRTRPGASVEVRIGEAVFGPATAGRDGVALIPVEVPPGVDSVLHGARRIPLDIPPISHAALFPWPAAAPADRAQVVPLLVVAVEPGGAPRQGPAPALTVSAGALGRPEPAGPGLWRVAWTLPAGPVGPVTARATLPREPAAEARLARPAGDPASIDLTVERPAASADDGPLAVTIALRDHAGHPADGAVALAAEAGEVTEPRRQAAGQYAATWTPPRRLEGRAAAELTARSGAAEARARVALQPGAAVRLALSAPAEVVTADGREALPLLAELLDAHGNPVPRPLTAARAGAGEVGAPRPDGPGRFLLDYRPRRVAAWAEDAVVAEATPLAASLPLRLRPPTARLTLEARAGLALQGGSWTGLQLGAGVTAWRWLAGQELGLGLSAAHSRFGDQRSAAAGSATVDFEGQLRTTTVLASAGWRRSAGRTFAVGAGLGAGAGRIESLVSTGGPLRSEAAWRPALGADAWVGWPVWRGRLVLALRGEWLADPGLASLRGTVAPLSLSLGYQHDVP